MSRARLAPLQSSRGRSRLRGVASGAGLLLISLLIPIAVANAATPSFGFKVWTADSGLPQNIIRGIYQTPEGYIWVATLDGIARFDGVQFTVFDKASTPGIQSSRFGSMFGRGDELWLGTDGGGLTRYHQRRFTTYTAADGLPQAAARAITGDSAGNIWVLCADAILAWNATTNRFVDVTPANLKIRYDWLLWEGGGFWGVDQHTLYCFIAGTLLRYPLPAWLSGPSIWGVARDQRGGIWLETVDGRQARIGDGTSAAEATTMSSEHTTTSYRDSRGVDWEFGIGHHLVRYVSHVSPGNVDQIAFSMLYQDREGSLWLGTEGQGLYQLRGQFITTYSTEHGLVDRNVYPIYQDRRGAVWVGGWRGGVSRFADGTVTNYTAAEGLPNWGITALAEDRQGRLWAAANEELRLFEGGRWHKPEAPVPPPRAVVQAMLQDRQGRFWLGTTRGLLRYQNGMAKLLTVDDGLATNDVRVLVEAANGTLWIGGYGGLSRLRGDRLEHWTERDGLPSNTIRAIHEDDDGVVWLGSYDGGLGRFKDGRFTRYTTRAGLFNNGAFQILEDRRGNLWMSSNRGIYRVSKRDLNEYAAGARTAVTSVSYGTMDGMRNVECNGGFWPAGITASDGRLWFPTQDGVALIDTEAVRANRQPPPVIIEAVVMDREPLPVDVSIRIPASQENFEIQYTALSFVNAEQNRFRYRLERLDSGWTEAGRRRSAYYSHVPPGEYVFVVTAGNSDGVWNEQGQRLRITVLAPFYRTVWFRVLMALGLMTALGAAWRYRAQQFQRAQALQQAFARQLISSQEHERKRIPAEPHDSLGQRLVVMKNLALLLLRERHESERARRIGAIEEISAEASLALHETREISYNLRPFQLDRLGLTKAVEALVRTAAAASAVHFTSAIDDIDEIFPDAVRINFYRIVQESLNNVVRHAGATEAHVVIRRTGTRIVLTIRDDGQGFSPSVSRAGTGESGFGLTGMSKRARLLGGRLDILSSPGRGTEIRLVIERTETGHD